jgi:hypothetical protein
MINYFNNDDYSQNELKLFGAFNLAHLVTHLPAPSLYRLAVEEAFLKNLQGPHVEALRRGANAMQEMKPYRKTPEFDKLVEF